MPLRLTSRAEHKANPIRRDNWNKTKLPRVQVRWSSLSRNPKRKASAASAWKKEDTHNRLCPYRVFRAHEVHPAQDVDWTRTGDWSEEQERRMLRNILIKEQLLGGRTVQYCSSGNSLKPDVWSGDCCLFEPVESESDLEKGDIVFCQVQPGDKFYAHKILKVESVKAAGSARGRYRKKYTIGKNKGHTNGYCYIDHIYGRLFEVLQVNW